MSTEAIGLYGLVRIDGATVGQRAMEGVRASFDKAGDAAQKAARHWEGAKRVLHGVVQAGTNLLAVMLTVGTAGAGALAVGAVKASVSYEELQARLEAVTGSAEEMRRKLAFAQEVAGPSNFTFMQLADATVLLEAFKINAERALPTVARLGMAFNANDEQLQTLVRGLGDLSTGKFFEADVASAFGLNRDMFREKGIEFDGTGQLVSSADKAFEALEQIVNEKYGSIFDKMKDTNSVKLASLQDVWEKFQRVVGDGILKVIGPSIDVLSRALNALVGSGVLEDAINRFADGFLKLFNADKSAEGLVRFVAGVVSFVSNIPKLAESVGQAFLHIFEVLDHNLEVLFNHIDKRIAQITAAIGSVAAAIPAMIRGDGEEVRSIFAARDAAVSAMSAVMPGDKFKTFDLKQFAPDMFDKQDEWTQKMLALMKPMDATVPEARGEWLYKLPAAMEESNELLRGIKGNSDKQVMELADMRRQILGGGERGQIGATAAERMGGGAAYGSGKMTPYGFVTNEVLLRFSTPDAARMIRLEATRGSGTGRGFNPR